MPYAGEWIDSEPTTIDVMYEFDTLSGRERQYNTRDVGGGFGTLDYGGLITSTTWATFDSIYTHENEAFGELYPFPMQENAYDAIGGVDDTAGYRYLNVQEILLAYDLTYRNYIPLPTLHPAPGAYDYEWETPTVETIGDIELRAWLSRGPTHVPGVDPLLTPEDDPFWVELGDYPGAGVLPITRDTSGGADLADIQSFGWGFNIVDSSAAHPGAYIITGWDGTPHFTRISDTSYDSGATPSWWSEADAWIMPVTIWRFDNWIPAASLGPDINESTATRGGIAESWVAPYFKYTITEADLTTTVDGQDMAWVLMYPTGYAAGTGPIPSHLHSSFVYAGIVRQWVRIHYTPPRYRWIYAATPPLHQAQRTGGMETHAYMARSRNTRQSSLLQRGPL